MSKHSLEDASAPIHDSKRRKKDRKAALKLEDITPSSTDATANSTPAPEQQEEEDSTYKQNDLLSKLPQGDVDQFYKGEAVQVTDPQTSNLRPILQFSHLPVELKARHFILILLLQVREAVFDPIFSMAVSPFRPRRCGYRRDG